MAENEVIEKTLSKSIPQKPRVASPTVSIEELTPHPKRRNNLKDLSMIPSHELVNCHIHKLIQVSFINIALCIFLFLE